MAPGVVFDDSESKTDDSSATSDTSAPTPPQPPPFNNGLPTWTERQRLLQETIPPTPPPVDQFTNLPAALLSNLKREKKPFTYTPGGIDLSEIKSPKMQKRLEANKKLQGVISPLARPPEACGGDETNSQLVVLPVYNSPLNIYSSQNAKEALQKQANMLTKELESLTLSSNGEGNRYNTWSKSNNSDYSSKYGQSRSFRMLQLMTDTTDDDTEGETLSEPPPKHEDDEMRFTGITREAIPSKFFHTLQKITGTDGISPEPSPMIQYENVPCPLQAATYGKDFIPPPKTSRPFESAGISSSGGWTAPSRNENISQRNSYPQYRTKEEPPMYQTANQSSTVTSNPQFNPISHARSFSDVYQQKAPQPFIRPNFQAAKPGTSSTWQPSNNPYSYCTLPRGYRGIPGIEGTDL